MVKEKIDELIEQLAIKQLDGNITEPYFYRIYPFTNENLNAYFSQLDLKDKKILTVGSSGDQILYALLNDASDITCMDISPYAKFFIDLKIASIRAFDFKEFRKFFNFAKKSNDIISSYLYSKVSHFMPEDSKYFWDNIFLEFDKVAKFANSHIILSDHYASDEEQFKRIKEKLNRDFSLRFINTDIKDIIPLIDNERFDAIFLSNVYDYVDEWSDVDKQVGFSNLTFHSDQQRQFFNICNDFMNLLNPNGVLQVDYAYDNMHLNSLKYMFSSVFDRYDVYDIKTGDGGPIIIQKPDEMISVKE